MAKKEIRAIASADWHLSKRKDFNNLNRLKWSIRAGDLILDICKKHKVPLLFAGDLFHTPKEVENPVVTVVNQQIYDHCEENDIYAIPGNHDMSEKNTLNNRSPNYLDAFSMYPKFRQLFNEGAYHNSMYIYGVPYYDFQRDWLQAIHNANDVVKGIKKKYHKILLLHGNAPGSVTPLGLEIESVLPQNLDDFFKDWDLVLFGHIHKPMKLSRKAYMLGSPAHQERSDEGCEMGYWEIYSDGSIKFIPLNDELPEFITMTAREFEQYDVACPKACPDFITIVDDQPDTKEIEQEAGVYKANSSRKLLAEMYCNETGIKDKKKIKALQKILSEI